jgi:ABC-2 type transport system ATP-binding protein
MIEVKNLTKQYGSHIALNNVSFKAHEGEILGLLGPNGAGKTTTMRILTGFMPPSEGSAIVAGYDVMHDSLRVRQQVGYLPERVPLYPDMTVESYLAFWARLRGLKRPQPRVKAVLEQVNLLDRRKSLIRSLSKGMKQRLGLAQALVHEPKVIILDEPTIGIDPQQVIEVRESVRALAKDHTVLFSTHILSEAEQVCDRVVILNKGYVVAHGKPEALRQQLDTGGHIYVQFTGASEGQIRKMLDKSPAVASYQKQAAGYDVRGQRGVDVREAVYEQAAKAGIRIVELRPVAMTLEDIFLDLVGREE